MHATIISWLDTDRDELDAIYMGAKAGSIPSPRL
jgi:hypothetical protein